MNDIKVSEEDIERLAEFFCLQLERDRRRFNREHSLEEDEI